ncbi:MAG: hypothetical protein ABI306_10455 [Caulobacteraceae bacterium]
MPHTDPRGALIRAFDAHSRAFVEGAGARIERGRRLAQGDVAHLTDLAEAVAAALTHWRRIVEALDLAPAAAFDTGRAGALVLESVFDDLLAPDAWRVLAAAFDLAMRPS